MTIGRNPNGIGRFYDEVTDFWNRRQGRGAPILDQLDPAVTALVPPAPAGVAATVGTEVRSVV